MTAVVRPIIGVFDSGIGGLTVLRELLESLPYCDYVYFADTARLPYGSKSVKTVSKFTISSARCLERLGAERIVIACNSASALALPMVCESIKVPVTGVVECGAESAAKSSTTRRVAVIATEATVASHAYRKALANFGLVADERACPLLVPLVEEGWIDHPITEEVARIYLQGLFTPGALANDVLVLGCTHYPLLKPLLQRLIPAWVKIVDSARSVASTMQRQMGPPPEGAQIQSQSLRFLVTDPAEKFRIAGERFLGIPVNNITLVEMEA